MRGCEGKGRSPSAGSSDGPGRAGRDGCDRSEAGGEIGDGAPKSPGASEEAAAAAGV